MMEVQGQGLGSEKAVSQEQLWSCLCFGALQVVLLCWENRLYDAMIYVYNSGMNDFISPMEVGELLLHLLGCSAHILPEKQHFKPKALLYSLYSAFLLISISRGESCVICAVYFTGCSRGET